METQKINSNASEHTQEAKNAKENAKQRDPKNSNWGKTAATAAAGIVGGVVGGFSSNAMANNNEEESQTHSERPTIETEQSQPESVIEETPASQETETEHQPENTTEENHQVLQDEPINPTKPESDADPNTVANDIIEGEYIDLRDSADNMVLNVEEVGVVNIEGNDLNAATVTDDEGNTLLMVDVDGIPGDMSGTYDIVLDESGNMMTMEGLTMTVGDATMLAQANHQETPNYIEPNHDTIYGDIAMNDVDSNIIDPSTLA